MAQRIDQIALVLLAAGLVACGGATSQTRLADPATLLAERDEWRGERGGPVALRLHVEAIVDTRPDPASAESALVVHVALADYRGPAATPTPIALPVPRGARLIRSDLRFVAAPPAPTSPAALAAEPRTTPGGLDPDQDTITVTLPAPPDGGLVEAILRFEVAGTLASDARWLGLPGLPVAEAFLQYQLASDTVGSFQTTLPNARPVVTERDGRRLIALLASNLPAITDPRAAPLARYVTVKASPKGYDQSFTTDWATATRAYRTHVVEASRTLDDGYAVPYTPAGAGKDAALDALAWVLARPMRAPPADPFDVRWDAARPLPGPISKNDLTAVDRVHLLHWILREAKLPHTFVMARAAHRPPLDPAFPAPGLFDAPLIQLSTYGLVLDPACDTCAPGEVRASLRGGQALAIPLHTGPTGPTGPTGERAALFDLPTSSTP